MQALFQLDIQGDEGLGRLKEFFQNNCSDNKVLALANKWANGCWEHKDKCDELIVAAAMNWEMDRLSQVDKSILRLCTYQLLVCTDIPHKVVINEGIELAKKFSTGTAPAFINGVLDAIHRKLNIERQGNATGESDKTCDE